MHLAYKEIDIKANELKTSDSKIVKLASHTMRHKRSEGKAIEETIT